MKNSTERDKQLLENLDRILAGRESEIKEPSDDEARTALEFAGKIVSLREKPSKEFTANLKAELIHQLAEQEKKERSSDQSFLLWGIEIPRRTMWQGTIAAAIVVIITVVILLVTIALPEQKTILTETPAPPGQGTAFSEWINFIKFNDIMYERKFVSLESYRDEDLTYYDSVRFKVADNIKQGSGYRIQNGDAAFLEAGTPIYSIRGYSPSFRLAAKMENGMILFEADTNPLARKGADLLDIAGKVEYIGINSPIDGLTELASIRDAGLVSSLVEMVLNAPVDQTVVPPGGEQLFIAFHLNDGTAVIRSYLPGTGELSRGILLPDEFRQIIRSFVP